MTTKPYQHSVQVSLGATSQIEPRELIQALRARFVGATRIGVRVYIDEADGSPTQGDFFLVCSFDAPSAPGQVDVEDEVTTHRSAHSTRILNRMKSVVIQQLEYRTQSLLERGFQHPNGYRYSVDNDVMTEVREAQTFPILVDPITDGVALSLADEAARTTFLTTAQTRRRQILHRASELRDLVHQASSPAELRAIADDRTG